MMGRIQSFVPILDWDIVDWDGLLWRRDGLEDVTGGFGGTVVKAWAQSFEGLLWRGSE